MNARVQVDALTGVRGIAAWLVVLYHVRESFVPSLPAAATALFAKGYLAVDLFFVLSGFVLWMTWGDRFVAEGLRAAPGFLRKRIARVWPLHVVILTATVAFAVVIDVSGRPLPASYRWDELPLHYLLIQNWGFTETLAWNDPSWSISTELAAYLLFPFAAAALGRLGGGAPQVRMAVSAGAAIALAILLDRYFAAHGRALIGDDIAGLGLVRCLLQFGCGMAMCVVWQVRGDGALAASAGVVIAVLASLWTAGLLRETLAVPLLFSALVAFIAATSAWRGNPLSSRIAVFLGEISYSTYLVHFLLWTLFKIALVQDVSDVPLVLGAVYLVAVFVASVLLYRIVEVPARIWIGGAMPTTRRTVRA